MDAALHPSTIPGALARWTCCAWPTGQILGCRRDGFLPAAPVPGSSEPSFRLARSLSSREWPPHDAFAIEPGSASPRHAERLQRLDWEWMEEKNPWAAVVSRRRRIGRLRRKDVFLSSGRDLTKVKNLFL
ncbi:unnamed protein product [Durusdinium trenchii]|uniref:Uncharacterized protein n=1 Tax=Durusdinium trenchii TaxID=1381693 RepID=A0ABP0KM70_9DINO